MHHPPVRFEATHGDVSAVQHHHTPTAAVLLKDHMQSGLQEDCWRSAERWCTLISVNNEIGIGLGRQSCKSVLAVCSDQDESQFD